MVPSKKGDAGTVRSYLLMLLGIAIAYASALTGLAILPGSLMFLLLRINAEEKMLLEHFGTPYEAYLRRTKRLIPLIY